MPIIDIGHTQSLRFRHKNAVLFSISILYCRDKKAARAVVRIAVILKGLVELHRIDVDLPDRRPLVIRTFCIPEPVIRSATERDFRCRRCS